MSANDIAVVGVAVRLPHARGAEAFWRLLCEGKDTVGKGRFPDGRRADIEHVMREIYGPSAPQDETDRFFTGGWFDRVDQFDPAFFGMTPAQALAISPQQRFFLETAWECIEDAGYGSSIYGTKTSVVVGNSFNQYKLILTQNSTDVSHGNHPPFIGGRVSFTFDLHGPGAMVATGCSSSLLAVHDAAQKLRAGECDMAIAGGVTLDILPIDSPTDIWNQLGITRAGQRCAVFSDNASGIAKGEGSAAVMLRRVADAVRDGNHIYGILKSTTANHDGRSNGITAPQPRAQTQLLCDAWRLADIEPGDVSYIEAHGTGTRLGDPIEVEAITNAFRQFTDARHFCAIGSVKANIGHLADGAAGVVGLIKTLLCMQHRQLPPSIHCTPLNTSIDWSEQAVFVNQQLRDWFPRRPTAPRLAGVSAFGLLGTNVHVVVQEFKALSLISPPRPIGRSLDSVVADNINQLHLLCCAAASRSALGEFLSALIYQLDVDSPPDFADVCFTLSAGRRIDDLPWRVLVNAPDTAAACLLLRRLIANVTASQPSDSTLIVTDTTSHVVSCADDNDPSLEDVLRNWTSADARPGGLLLCAPKCHGPTFSSLVDACSQSRPNKAIPTLTSVLDALVAGTQPSHLREYTLARNGVHLPGMPSYPFETQRFWPDTTIAPTYTSELRGTYTIEQGTPTSSCPPTVDAAKAQAYPIPAPSFLANVTAATTITAAATATSAAERTISNAATVTNVSQFAHGILVDALTKVVGKPYDTLHDYPSIAFLAVGLDSIALVRVCNIVNAVCPAACLKKKEVVDSSFSATVQLLTGRLFPSSAKHTPRLHSDASSSHASPPAPSMTSTVTQTNGHTHTTTTNAPLNNAAPIIFDTFFPVNKSAERIWLMHQKHSQIYNIGNGVVLSPDQINVPALKEAVRQTVRAHSALFTTLSMNNGQINQRTESRLLNSFAVDHFRSTSQFYAAVSPRTAIILHFAGQATPFATCLNNLNCAALARHWLTLLAGEARLDSTTARNAHALDQLAQPEGTLSPTLLAQATVSMPGIFLAQVGSFWDMKERCQMTLPALHATIQGSVGHSQGLVAAYLLANRLTEDAFLDAVPKIAIWLMRVGALCDSRSATPDMSMLAVLRVDSERVQSLIKTVNATSNGTELQMLVLSLENGQNNWVVSGPPSRLACLCKELPSNQWHFLPTRVPFHHPLLQGVCEEACRLAEDLHIAQFFHHSSLAVPVYSGIREPTLSSVETLVRAMLVEPVCWPTMMDAVAKRITEVGSGCHVVDCGPGEVDLTIASLSNALLATPNGDVALISSYNADVPTQQPVPRESADKCAQECLDVLMARTQFNLGAGPLIRVVFVDINEDVTAMLTIVHHIVFDGHSHFLFYDEMWKRYHQAAADSLPVEHVTLATVAQREQDSFRQLASPSKLRAWRALLANSRATVVPGDIPRPKSFTFRGAKTQRVINANDMALLRQLMGSSFTTLFEGLFGVLGVVLHLLTGETDQVVGTSFSGRHHNDEMNTVGMFANTLPWRLVIDQSSTFVELVKHIHKMHGKMDELQTVPFDELVRSLGRTTTIDEGFSNPLFNVCMVLHSAAAITNTNSLSQQPDGVRRFTPCDATAKWDFYFDFLEERAVVGGSSDDTQMFLRLEWYSDAYSSAFVDSLLDLLSDALHHLVLRPTAPLSSTLATMASSSSSLASQPPSPSPLATDDWLAVPTNTLVLPDITLPVHKMLERVVDKDDTTVAWKSHCAEGTDESATLTQLLFEARNLARLISQKAQHCVGVLAASPRAHLVSVLACLISGCTLVPLDAADCPEDHLLAVLASAPCSVVCFDKSQLPQANRLLWNSAVVTLAVCVDSDDLGSVVELPRALGTGELWNEVFAVGHGGGEVEAAGWRSSFTNETFDANVMDDFKRNTLAKLLPLLKPTSRVLEIGSASCLTMRLIANRVSEYIATDVASEMVAFAEKIARDEHLPNVRAYCASAIDVDQLESVARGGFDLIILNSVVQYFPGHSYMREVMRRCGQLLRPTGAIFVGDILDRSRHSQLIESLVEHVHQNKSYGSTKLGWSEELFLTREYLEDVCASMPEKFSCVFFSDKLGAKTTLVQSELHLRMDAVFLAPQAPQAPLGSTSTRSNKRLVNLHEVEQLQQEPLTHLNASIFHRDDNTPAIRFVRGQLVHNSFVHHDIAVQTLSRFVVWQMRQYKLNAQTRAPVLSASTGSSTALFVGNLSVLCAGGTLVSVPNDQCGVVLDRSLTWCYVTPMQLFALVRAMPSGHAVSPLSPTTFTLASSATTPVTPQLLNSLKKRQESNQSFDVYIEHFVVPSALPVLSHHISHLSLPIACNSLTCLGAPIEAVIVDGGIASVTLGPEGVPWCAPNRAVVGRLAVQLQNDRRWWTTDNLVRQVEQNSHSGDTWSGGRERNSKVWLVGRSEGYDDKVNLGLAIVEGGRVVDLSATAHLLRQISNFGDAMVDILPQPNGHWEVTAAVKQEKRSTCESTISIAKVVRDNDLPVAGNLPKNIPPCLLSSQITLETSTGNCTERVHPDEDQTKLPPAIPLPSWHPLAQLWRTRESLPMTVWSLSVAPELTSANVGALLNGMVWQHPVLAMKLQAASSGAPHEPVVLQPRLHDHAAFDAHVSFSVKTSTSVADYDDTVAAVLAQYRTFESSAHRFDHVHATLVVNDREPCHGLKGNTVFTLILAVSAVVADNLTCSMLVRDMQAALASRDAFETKLAGMLANEPDLGWFRACVADVTKAAQVADELSVAQELFTLPRALCLPSIHGVPEASLEGTTERWRVHSKTMGRPLVSALAEILLQETGFACDTVHNKLVSQAAVVVLLMSRYGLTQDLSFGLALNQRSSLTGESAFGPLSTVSPVRVQIPSTARSFADLLRLVIAAIQHARLSYSHFPLLHLLQSTSIPDAAVDGTSTKVDEPLFRIAISLGDDDVYGASNTGLCDLVFHFRVQKDDRIELQLRYNQAQVAPSCAANMCDQFVCLVESVVEKKTTQGGLLNELRIMSRRDEVNTIKQSSGLSVERSDGLRGAKSIVDAVEKRARVCPERIAIICDEHTLTYAELLTEMEMMSFQLRRCGVGRGSIVTVLLDRTLRLVPTLLGILKTGAAYSCLDPDFPQARCLSQLRDAKPSVFVSESSLEGVSKTLCLMNDAKTTPILLILDALPPLLESERSHLASTAPDVLPSADDVAAYIFTSGSTGRPKGCGLYHESIQNVIAHVIEDLDMTRYHCWLAPTTVTFDVFQCEAFAPLVMGQQLVLATAREAADPGELSQLLDKHQVDVVQTTPTRLLLMIKYTSAWRRFAAGSTLLMSVGEPLPQRVAETLQEYAEVVWNGYGPSECSIYLTGEIFRRGTQPTVGRPVSNSRAYVMDTSTHTLMPNGVPGEICMAGVCVGSGYLNDEELTAERYLTDPFVPSDRMFRTGDLGYWNSSGSLVCLGRIDEQIKLHGYRIELGEVENVLLECAGVTQAACRKHGDMLVAYVAPHLVDVNKAERHLSQRLPAYMMPSIVPMFSIPQLRNGKVNTLALPHPDDVHLSEFAVPVDMALRDHVATLLALNVPNSAHPSHFVCVDSLPSANLDVARMWEELEVEADQDFHERLEGEDEQRPSEHERMLECQDTTVDRTGLRHLMVQRLAAQMGMTRAIERHSPMTDTQRTVQRLWMSLLPIRTLANLDDNFFHIGGDSIGMVRVTMQLQHLGFSSLTVKMVREHPTIRLLSTVLDRLQAVNHTTVESADALSSVHQRSSAVAAPIVQEFFASGPVDVNHYALPAIIHLQLSDALTESRFVHAVKCLIERHEALRSRFWWDTESGRVLMEPIPPLTASTDLIIESVKLPPPMPVTAKADFLAHPGVADALASLESRLDLSSGRVVTLGLLYDIQGGLHAALVVNHVAIDFVSWDILLRELDADLVAAQTHAPSLISLAHPVPIGNYTRALASAFLDNGSVLREAQAHWHQVVVGARDAVRIPRALVRDGADSAAASLFSNCGFFSVEVESPRAGFVSELARLGCSMEDLVFCAFAHAAGEKVTVAVEHHGRNGLGDVAAPDMAVGYVTARFPVTLPLHAQLGDIKDVIALAAKHSVAYGMLRFLIDPKGTSEVLPLPEIEPLRTMVVHLGVIDEEGIHAKSFRHLPWPLMMVQGELGRRVSHRAVGERRQFALEVFSWSDPLDALHFGVSYDEKLMDEAAVKAFLDRLITSMHTLLETSQPVGCTDASDWLRSTVADLLCLPADVNVLDFMNQPALAVFGADSLRLRQLSNIIQQTWQVDEGSFTTAKLQSQPTLASLATLLDAAGRKQQSTACADDDTRSLAGTTAKRTHPVSRFQECMLFEALKMQAVSDKYVESIAFVLVEDVNMAVAQERCLNLLKTFPMLTSTFETAVTEKQKEVFVRRERAPESVLRIETSTARVLDVAWEHLRSRSAAGAFRMSLQGSESLCRFSVVMVPDKAMLVAVHVHHILIDAACYSLLESILVGQDVRASLPVSFDAFVEKERVYLASDSEALEEDRQFWENLILGEGAVKHGGGMLLPVTDRHNDSRGFEVRQRLASKTWGCLLQQCKVLGVSPFHWCLATHILLISRYIASDNVFVMVPVSNRQYEHRNTMGALVNTVVVRVAVPNTAKKTASFGAFVQQVAQSTRAAVAHGRFPFDEVCNMLNKTAGIGDVGEILWHMFNMEVGENGAGRTLTHLMSADQKFPLSIDVVEVSRGTIEVVVAAQETRMSSWQAALILRNFTSLVGQLCHQVDVPVHKIGVVDNHDQLCEQMLSMNRSVSSSARAVMYESVFEMFQHRVQQFAATKSISSAPALVSGANMWTRQELLTRALDVSRQLVSADSHDALRHTPVVLIGHKAPEMVWAILGVWHAGGHVQMVNDTWPSSRVQKTMKRLTNGALMLTNSSDDLVDKYLHEDDVTERLTWLRLGRDQTDEVRVVRLARVSSNGVHESAQTDGPSLQRSQHLAYVIYTSGTTGEPKRCETTHANLTNMAVAWRNDYELGEYGTTVLQWAPMTFDVFFGDVVRSLCSTAGCLVLCPDERRLDAEWLVETIGSQRVTHFETTPQFANCLVQVRGASRHLANLKILIVGSDVGAPNDFRVIRDTLGPSVRIFNSYGMSEATIDSSFYEWPVDSRVAVIGNSNTVPIGRPMSGVTMHVMDPVTLSHTAPVGGIGELCIGGASVTTTNGDEVTLAATGETLMRTHDIARWMPGGYLEHLGRQDATAKVNGCRVNTIAIAACAREQSKSVGAAHAVVGDFRDRTVLVVYVAPILSSDGDENACVERVALENTVYHGLVAQLPCYQVPDAVFALHQSSMPLNDNGKLLVSSLPSIESVMEREMKRRECEEKKEERGKTSGEDKANGEPARLLEIVSLLCSEFESVTNVCCRPRDSYVVRGASLQLVRFHLRLKTQLAPDLDLGELLEYRSFFELAHGLHERELAKTAVLARGIDNPAGNTESRDESTESHHVAHEQENLAANKRKSSSIASETSVAIVGVAVHLPGGIRSLWDLQQAQENGKNLVRPLPHHRLEQVLSTPSTASAARHAASASRFECAFLEDIDQFDAEHFDIPLFEAQTMMPEQRLFLTVASAALRDAHLLENVRGTRTGVFVGPCDSGYGALIEGLRMPATAIPGTMASTIPARVAYAYDLKGPAVVVNGACASGLVALQQACRSVGLDDCKAAIVGGVNIVLDPVRQGVFGDVSILAPDFQCRALDANAQGTSCGEGVIALVVKKLSAAERDGDHVYGVVESVEVSNVGRSGGITAPTAKSQVETIERALSNAGLTSRDLAVVEAHGTGTLLGDAMESHALCSVFAPRLGEQPRETPLLLSASKPTFGHLDSAAGLLGVCNLLASFMHGTVAPIAHLCSPNPTLATHQESILPVQAGRVALLPTGTSDIYGGVTSLGLNGTVAHAVLRSICTRRSVVAPTSSLVLRVDETLSERAGMLATYLEDTLPRVAWGLVDVAHTLAIQETSRGGDVVVIVAETQVRDACQQLRNLLAMGRKTRDELLAAHFQVVPATGDFVALHRGRRVPVPDIHFLPSAKHLWWPTTLIHNGMTNGGVKHGSVQAQTGSVSFAQRIDQAMFDTREVLRTLNLHPDASYEEDIRQFCNAIVAQFFDTCGIQLPFEGTVEELREHLGVLPFYDKLLVVMMRGLVEAGVSQLHCGKYSLSASSLDGGRNIDVVARSQAMGESHRDFRDCFRFPLYVSTYLPRVLRGDMSPLDVLYPSAQLFFVEQNFTELGDKLGDVFFNVYIRSICEHAVARARKHLAKTGRPLRLLECGAGMGLVTRQLLPRLWETMEPGSIEYMFTDLGNAFVQNARRVFAEFPFVKYAVFDITRPLCDQLGHDEPVDMILSYNVIHTTKSVERSLKNLTSSLAPDGELFVIESTKNEVWSTLAWGILEGWWYFEDYDVRASDPMLEPHQWVDMMGRVGLDVIHCPGDDDDESLLVEKHLFYARRRAQGCVEHSKPNRLTKACWWKSWQGNAQLRAAEVLQAPGSGQSEMPLPRTRDDVYHDLRFMWTRLLGMAEDQLEPHTSFKEAGGESLLAVELAQLIKAELGVTVGFADIFGQPTLSLMATLVHTRIVQEFQRRSTKEDTESDATTTRHHHHQQQQQQTQQPELLQRRRRVTVASTRDQVWDKVDEASLVVVMMPGQGVQEVGMGARVRERSLAMGTFERAKKWLEYDLLSCCVEGQLSTPLDVQLGVFTTTVAAMADLQLPQEGNNAMYMYCGLSLGEYAALHCAGVFDFEDALELVRLRADFIQQAARQYERDHGYERTGMLSVRGLGVEDVLSLLHRERQAHLEARGDSEDVLAWPVLSTHLAEKQVVLGGRKAHLEKIMAALNDESDSTVVCTMLRTPFAFHTPMLEGAAQKMAQALHERLSRFHMIRKGRRLVLNSRRGCREFDSESSVESIMETLAEGSISNQVHWLDIIASVRRASLNTRATVVVEPGRGRVLTSLLAREDDIEVDLFSFPT